jgi:ABC-type nitrate/sulfonate/bicarbonate transport system substrate-binding protein
MKSSPMRRRRLRKLLPAMLLIPTAVLVAACSSSSSAASSPAASGTAAAAGSKPLSLTNVTIAAGSSPSNALLFIALQQGYFTKLGLNVKWLNATTDASSATAVILSGSAQFMLNDAPPVLLAAAKGAPLKGVFCSDTGVVQDIAISSSFAKAHNIAATATTQAEATAQFLALKGSHAKIAVSNTASQSYYDVVTLAKLNHLTVGPNGDINVVTLGTPTALVAALNTGKVDGIVNAPPTTVQPNSIQIPLYLIPPVPISCGLPLATTTSMISSHPDVVQAVVTAMTQALYFVKSNPAQAKADAAKVIEGAGIKAASFNAAYPSEATSFSNPVITTGGYNAEVELMNDAASPPLSLSYSQFVVPTFFNAAVKKLGAPS